MVFCSLLHDELLGVVASVDEVDAAAQVADVNGVDANVTFEGVDHLTHHVADDNRAVVAQHDAHAFAGRVGIHIDGGAHSFVVFLDAVVTEEVFKVIDDALIVVVGRVGVITQQEGVGGAVHLAGDDERKERFRTFAINDIMEMTGEDTKDKSIAEAESRGADDDLVRHTYKFTVSVEATDHETARKALLRYLAGDERIKVQK